jgi:hypothetical protein
LDNGKYAIDDENYFSCGYPIEVYNKGQWQIGKVEYSNKYGGYYFYNHDGENTPLKEGLRVRTRK